MPVNKNAQFRLLCSVPISRRYRHLFLQKNIRRDICQMPRCFFFHPFPFGEGLGRGFLSHVSTSSADTLLIIGSTPFLQSALGKDGVLIILTTRRKSLLTPLYILKKSFSIDCISLTDIRILRFSGKYLSNEG